MIITILLCVIALHYILIDQLKLHRGRITIEQGWLYVYCNYDYTHEHFINGQGLFRVLPLWVYRREWTFFYGDSCSCQFIKAYTRKGAIRKAKDKYSVEEYKRFNIKRLKGRD